VAVYLLVWLVLVLEVEESPHLRMHLNLTFPDSTKNIHFDHTNEDYCLLNYKTDLHLPGILQKRMISE